VAPVSWSDLTGADEAAGLDTGSARRLVAVARRRQAERLPGHRGLNSMLPSRDVLRVCALTAAGGALLEGGVATFRLSARAVHRTLRVARTIADLSDREHLGEQEIAEALRLRVGLHGAGTTPPA